LIGINKPFDLLGEPALSCFEASEVTRGVFGTGAAGAPRFDFLQEHPRALGPATDRVPHERVEFVPAYPLRGASLLGAPFQPIGMAAIVIEIFIGGIQRNLAICDARRVQRTGRRCPPELLI
jgi:hypothetical protein